jgi:hypothetical protein
MAAAVAVVEAAAPAASQQQHLRWHGGGDSSGGSSSTVHNYTRDSDTVKYRLQKTKKEIVHSEKFIHMQGKDSRLAQRVPSERVGRATTGYSSYSSSTYSGENSRSSACHAGSVSTQQSSQRPPACRTRPPAASRLTHSSRMTQRGSGAYGERGESFARSAASAAATETAHSAAAVSAFAVQAAACAVAAAFARAAAVMDRKSTSFVTYLNTTQLTLNKSLSPVHLARSQRPTSGARRAQTHTHTSITKTLS